MVYLYYIYYLSHDQKLLYWIQQSKYGRCTIFGTLGPFLDNFFQGM